MGVSARDARDHEELGIALGGLPYVRLSSEDFDRAWEVQALLVARGQHRGVALPDLLVAACAERLGLTVIHCDADFDLIGEVTGQPMRWAVDRSQL
jgi:predicted nucleic acid-binding protein